MDEHLLVEPLIARSLHFEGDNPSRERVELGGRGGIACVHHFDAIEEGVMKGATTQSQSSLEEAGQR